LIEVLRADSLEDLDNDELNQDYHRMRRLRMTTPKEQARPSLPKDKRTHEGGLRKRKASA
jgi:hypothetical protein